MQKPAFSSTSKSFLLVDNSQHTTPPPSPSLPDQMASISASRVPAAGLGAAQDTASTHPYTCNTCQVAFRNSELQRGHMRSDWQYVCFKARSLI